MAAYILKRLLLMIPTLLGILLHGTGNAVGREDDPFAARDLIEFLDEDRTKTLKALDHMAIMHDLMPDIDWRAIFLQRVLDHGNGPVNARAEAARIGQKYG